MTRTMSVEAVVRELIDRGYFHVTSDVPCPHCGAWPRQHATLHEAVEAVLDSPAVDRASPDGQLGGSLDEREIH